MLRHLVRADLDAARTELARLRDLSPAPSLPPLDVVLRDVGGWREALLGADIPGQREVPGALIDHVVPERTGYGRYTAHVAWSPLGEALKRLAAGLESPAAA